MGKKRLSNMALFSFDRENFEKINFDDLFDQFATVKSTKVYLCDLFREIVTCSPLIMFAYGRNFHKDM